MAEPARKTVASTTVSPLHEETAESPRPHAVPATGRIDRRAKEQASGADTVRRLRRRERIRWTLFALLPLALLAGGAALDRATDAILKAFADGPFIFNLGHGVLPDTPIEHVERLVSRVRGVPVYGAAAARKR